MDLEESTATALAAFAVKHGREPASAFGELTLLVGRLLGFALAEAERQFQRDAAIVMRRILTEQRALWMQRLKENAASAN